MVKLRCHTISKININFDGKVMVTKRKHPFVSVGDVAALQVMEKSFCFYTFLCCP